VTTPKRLTAQQRRALLVDAGARLFASHPYDEVQMDEVAELGGVSRALLYRHFAGKSDLFRAVYRQAADLLVTATERDPDAPLMEQVLVGLEAHIDYFVANRNTVLAANQVLAGDPTIQAVITDELATLRERLLRSSELRDRPREMTSALLMSWLVFVRVLSVEWLNHRAFTREQLRDTCLGALRGALLVDVGAHRSA
jgi:AcrR family transcriptional regulator